ESALRQPRSPAGTGGPPTAVRAGRSNRLDITGSRSARQATSTPAAITASAPATAAPRQGKLAKATFPGSPDSGVPAAPAAVRPGVDPAPERPWAPTATDAAASTSAAEIPAITAAAIPAPNPASRTPAMRRSVPRVARTAARPASAARASALAAGTSAWPETGAVPAGSGPGAAGSTPAPPPRTASHTQPAPAPPHHRTRGPPP